VDGPGALVGEEEELETSGDGTIEETAVGVAGKSWDPDSNLCFSWTWVPEFGTNLPRSSTRVPGLGTDCDGTRGNKDGMDGSSPCPNDGAVAVAGADIDGGGGADRTREGGIGGELLPVSFKCATFEW
jgi:hypothetical protein